MALRTAHGAHVYVGTFTWPVDTWRGSWTARTTEVTQSDSGGAAVYFPILEDNSWEASVGRDDTNYPEAIGLAPGTIVPTMYFRLGGGLGAVSDRLTNTTVEAVEPICDNKGDVVRVTVRGKGGKRTAAVASPTAL